MAQKKINPIAFRLSIKQTWWSITHSSNSFLYQDLFIRKLIKGTFNAFNILTSPIGIKRKGKSIFIDLLVYPYDSEYKYRNLFFNNTDFPHIQLTNRVDGKNFSYRGIWGLLKSNTLRKQSAYLNGNFKFRYYYIKSLLELILNKKYQGKNNISISVIEAPSIASNAQILCDWIDFEFSKSPNKNHRQILNKALTHYLTYQKNSKKVEGNNESYITLYKNYIKTI